MILGNKKILVILRHQNSLNIAQSFIEEHGGRMEGVALDVIELSEQVPEAMEKIRAGIRSSDAVILGTKVYDSIKDGPSHLEEFLDFLDECGVGSKPILLTHLHDMAENMKTELLSRAARLSWVENDNLKRDGMANLGPLLLRAFVSPTNSFKPAALG